MRFSSLRAKALASIALFASLSCSGDSITGSSRSTSELNLLHVTYDYPALVTSSVTFWAVKGKAGGADLWYHARAGAADSTKLVEFRLPADALDRRPDGSAIATGDSVQITLTATDPRHMMIAYEPSGLHFTATARPTLKMFWVGCGDDLNYDGKVDATDTQLIGQLAIWRQEAVDQPWFRLTSVVTPGAREIDTLLDGFSGYAISY